MATKLAACAMRLWPHLSRWPGLCGRRPDEYPRFSRRHSLDDRRDSSCQFRVLIRVGAASGALRSRILRQSASILPLGRRYAETRSHIESDSGLCVRRCPFFYSCDLPISLSDKRHFDKRDLPRSCIDCCDKSASFTCHGDHSLRSCPVALHSARLECSIIYEICCVCRRCFCARNRVFLSLVPSDQSRFFLNRSSRTHVSEL